MTDTRKTPEVLVVNQQTAAAMLGISTSTLRRWHREGRGPRTVRLSRLVRYRSSSQRRRDHRAEGRYVASRRRQAAAAQRAIHPQAEFGADAVRTAARHTATGREARYK